jgi:hypothetical protein
MLTECAHCHELVSVAERIKDWYTMPRLTKLGVLRAIANYGVLCDDCYNRQEAVR